MNARDEINLLREQIKEYEEMAYRFSCVLDHATGGLMSKTNYTKEAMYASIDDHIKKICDEAVAEALSDH